MDCTCSPGICNPDAESGRRPTIHRGHYVNVYLMDRAYGGPEEGGWWYDCGQAVRSFATHSAARAARLAERIERLWCAPQNPNRRSDMGSVLSEGRYVAWIEDHPAADWPAVPPYYE